MSFDLSALTATLPQVMTTHPSLISDPKTWNGSHLTFCPWWAKLKLWVAAQICASYKKEDISQAVCTCMLGEAKGYEMQLIDKYKAKEWPEWKNVTMGISENVSTTVGLHNIIKQ